jgi:hypothetical protein
VLSCVLRSMMDINYSRVGFWFLFESVEVEGDKLSVLQNINIELERIHY